VIDHEGGPPVPLWKVQVPTHIEQPSTPREPLSGYLARRAEKLNLPLNRTLHGSQALRPVRKGRGSSYSRSSCACSARHLVEL
jgi:hypothetical protein